ncbi:hypothetical protein WA026_012096 [Henosepilachna vigintioctopunctata]|uniref:Lipase domain-containing protein n=1 Tax=Henosepilachna vigintioctopunctata TaxID=420089 RepID=A0AAW1VE18_9CUCU
MVMRKFLLVLCFHSALVNCQDLNNLTFSQWIELIGDTVKLGDGDVKESDITLLLFTRTNPNVARNLVLHGQNEIDIAKPTKFIVHGWLENYLVEWYREMKDELLKYEDANVIQVDWSRVAKLYYVSSAKNTELVGNILGNFILENKIPSENNHLIGHSLGAHVVAFAGKRIKKLTASRVRRISALDPAGPYFRLPIIFENERLSREDAEIVDVIHTDGGFFGFDEPLGTVDIYVNGGRRRQPGCHDAEPMFDVYEILKNSFCSHKRSHDYFIQSLNNAEIRCHFCASYMNLRNNTCSTSKVYQIIHQNITEDMKGICAVNTGRVPPYFQ